MVVASVNMDDGATIAKTAEGAGSVSTGGYVERAQSASDGGCGEDTIMIQSGIYVCSAVAVSRFGP